MKDSDKDRTALAAVRMLINMMPAEDSKVGVVGFNKTATVLTKDAKGNNALLNLDSLTDVVYNGGTGIGNAVFEATELLKANNSDERAQAIILFTDGINDFGNDAIALSNCEENEATALLWAKKNNYLGYKHIELFGVNNHQGINSDMLNKTLRLHKNFEKTMGLIAIEDQGDGDYYLVDSNDMIYRFVVANNELCSQNIYLFEYILQRFLSVK